MTQYLNKKCQVIIAIFFSLLFFVEKSLALEQYERAWFGIMAQQSYEKDPKWLSYIFSQLRVVNDSRPWHSILLEGAVGYQLAPTENIWIGYRWTGRNLYNDFFQENRLFQQNISQIKSDLYRVIIRTRLEQITLSNNSKIGLRFRERFAFEIKYPLFENALPYLYDEVFFRLNRTAFLPESFLGENRLFLGFNLYVTPTIWWEIGYMNQFQVKAPQQTQNQMSHILSVTYNFS